MDARERQIRREFVGALLSLEGCPYVWARDFVPPREGGDCSGAGNYAGWETGLWPRSHQWTSKTIHTEWEPVEEPEPGDAVTYAILPRGLFGGVLITHVMFVTSGPLYLKDGAVTHKAWSVIGASGGNRFTDSVAKARAKGARVRRYMRHDYRNYVAGFRRLPIPEELFA